VPPSIPVRSEDLTPEWLTAVLTSTGALRHGRVVTVRRDRVGQEYGFTGVIARVQMTFAEAERNPPRSLIAKLPVADDGAMSAYRAAQVRDPSLAHRHYERAAREVRFYSNIRAGFLPTLYYAAADDRRRVVLLLEDVDGGRQGDVLQGCSVADARLVIDVLRPSTRGGGEGAHRKYSTVSAPTRRRGKTATQRTWIGSSMDTETSSHARSAGSSPSFVSGSQRSPPRCMQVGMP
jgi:hypothetical protein